MPIILAGCELFEEEPETTKKEDSTTYTYTYSCSVGGKKTIQIPNRFSAACKANWEYYARTYGCNDADNFAEAERRRAQCP